MIMLSSKQKLLLKFQKKNVIDSETTTSSDSELDDIDPMKLIFHKNMKIRNLFKAKIKQTLQAYEGKDLNEMDKKLLTGINEKRRVETEHTKDKMIGSLKKFLLQKIYEEDEIQRKQKALEKLTAYRDKLWKE